MTQSVHFLLVPDRAAARKVRRAIAEQSPRLGLMVGTWLELLEYARGSYLLPAIQQDFSENLATAAAKADKAFWSESFAVAPADTLAVLGRELERLLHALGPGKKLPATKANGLSFRAQTHLRDLARLHQAMDGALPDDLALIDCLLAREGAAATRFFISYQVKNLPRLNPWQRVLLIKLNGDVSGEGDPKLAALLEKCLLPEPAAKPKTALHALQANLFEPATKAVKLGTSVQWVGCRDYLEEVEVSAGMIQRALKEDETLTWSDFGLLLPDDDKYPPAVETVFAKAGLPLSGLVVNSGARDLGAELLRQYLLCLRKPAPIMALAALVTNPLLPWSNEHGRNLADQVMRGTFTLYPGKGMGPPARALIAAVNGGAEKPAPLRKALVLLSEHLPSGGAAGEVLKEHAVRAQVCIENLLGPLRGQKEIPWVNLLAQTQPDHLPRSREGDLSREGIAVMREGEEPWRAVRDLFVLGFQDGHFPRDSGSGQVFFEEDLEALNTALGLELPTPAEAQALARERFRRQLSAASRRVNFFLPRRNGLGEVLAPSSSLVYMAQLIDGAGEAEELVWDLDSTDDRAKIRGLALAAEAEPVPPREPERKDLKLKRDLLEPGEEGWPAAHQSPSSLDTLMVSPLAWVLSRYGLEPKGWAPQQLDPMLQGTLAHGVFERLFPAGKPLIAGNKVEAAAGKELARVIGEKAPFLQAPEWRVERFNLAHQVGMAALRWRHFLAATKAKVVGLEIRLKGRLDDLPLKGFADSLLRMPGGRLFVVDFKKSASGTRRKRMDKGYDSQAHLYRIMLETGGKDLPPELRTLLKTKPEIGIMYFLMNDQVALTDTDNWLGSGIEKLEEMGVDVAKNAMVEIRNRLAAVKRGRVPLNREGDAKDFDRNGVGAYALEASPLVSLFTVPAGEETP